MPVYAIDSSVIVAAVLTWHEHHERAHKALEQALQTNNAALPVHSLVESYSVMTRLPAPHRLSPQDALAVLEGTFRDNVKLARLRTRSVWKWLSVTVERGIAGGRTYDALILESARSAGATHLLTLNPRDFRDLDPALEIVEP
ncbi:MAG: PIN domain-containing protein [Deltaproteobacteria bacterium]|nr:PIN domain-containing protein [Deltaproteobacteria bacterium]